MGEQLELSIGQVVQSTIPSDRDILYAQEANDALESIERLLGCPRTHVADFLGAVGEAMPLDEYHQVRQSYFGKNAESVAEMLAEAGLLRFAKVAKVGEAYISPENLLHLGNMVLRAGRYVDARRCADALIELEGHNQEYAQMQADSDAGIVRSVDDLVRRGEAAVSQAGDIGGDEQYKEAISLYQEAVRLDGSNASLFYRLSTLYEELHMISCDIHLIEEAAIAAFNAVRLNPCVQYSQNLSNIKRRLLADVDNPSPELVKMLGLGDRPLWP